MSNISLDGYILYYTPYCPFCQRVESALDTLGISLQKRDTTNSQYRSELISGGGKGTVPCLKHPNGHWQYESEDIIKFLKEQVK